MDVQNERRDARTIKLRETINEIIQELEYQEQRWGQEHDHGHTDQDWMTILSVYNGKAASSLHPYNDAEKDNKSFRKRVTQIAAICMAKLIAEIK
jgi:hypothetical protein